MQIFETMIVKKYQTMKGMKIVKGGLNGKDCRTFFMFFMGFKDKNNNFKTFTL
jgi:hypothetical protein